MTGPGLPQAAGFNTAKLFACVIFSAIGFAAFVYGRKNKYLRPTIIGIVLMAYSYFISGTLAIYLVGIALTAALFLWR